MTYDIQKASFLKRTPAWLLDMILLLVLVTGFLFAWSYVFNVTPHINELSAVIEKYEEQFGGKLSIPTDEYEGLTTEEKAVADQISQNISNALNQDKEAVKLLELVATNIFAMVSLSVLCAYTILEFVIPLCLKNGQTLGKKCFGVALMRKDGVKVTPFMLFARTILGKCTVETMIPVLAIVLMLIGVGGPLMLLGVVVLLAQIITPIATRNKTAIHDLMACTVAVDLSSQMIFNSLEEQLEYHKQLHEEIAAEADQ